jgi:glycerol-3-phosphate dehydrogenase (NAD(P)+)
MIRVMGGGAFGTALAISLAQTGPVSLWLRNEEQALILRKTRFNEAYLPGVRLPDHLMIETGEEVGSAASATLLAIPMQKLRVFCTDHAVHLANAGPIVACCKGIELGTGMRPTQVIRDCLPDAPVAILTGPSFAVDIARGLPTALTLACAEDALGRRLQEALTTPNIRLYRTVDVIGAELGGALKNVMAIACGAAIGAGLGESARAALLTRGFAEMVRLAEAMGAKPDTLAGLSGFGDLVLTCTSDTSRNFQFGLSLGRNTPFSSAITVEGAATAEAVCDTAAETGLDLPIAQAVRGLVQGELQLREAMDMLLARPLKEE